MAKAKQSEADWLAQLTAQGGNSTPPGGGSTSAPGAQEVAGNAGMVLNRPPTVTTRKSAEDLARETDEKEKRIANANARADTIIASLPSVGTAHLPLHLIDDSPWQPRLTYDPAAIDELGDAMDAAGQAEAITVRKLGDRYQLLGGHRRTRAARNKGWTTIEAVVKECDDRQAQIIAMVQNGAREELAPWEKARAMAVALKDGLAKNQTEAGRLLGIKQNTVSDLLKMLELPEELHPLMNAKPDKIGPTHAIDYLKLKEENPGEEQLLLEGLKRVLENPKGTPFRGWVLQMLSARRQKTQRARKSQVVADESGNTIFSAKLDKNRNLVIETKAQEYDPEEVMKWVLAALRNRVAAKED